METINENGFLNRPKHHDTLYAFLTIAVITVLILFLIGVLRFHQTEKAKVIRYIDTVQSDSIPVLDKKILDKLCPVLEKREGYSGTVYTLNNQKLIGYGHALLKTDTFTYLDTMDALNLLKNDIRAAYFEVQRIHRKTLYSDVYSVFTSGKIN